MKKDVLDDVVRAAIRWWKQQRPTSFTEADHLANPTVNLSTKADKDLARAVAAMIAERAK